MRVSLPIARPAIAAGVLLAIMETIADYGTVAYFNVRTFSTGIYQAWFNMQDRAAAAQLALCLLAFALMLAAARADPARPGAVAHARRPADRRSSRSRSPAGAAGWRRGFCALPVVVGFLLPVVILGHHGGGVGAEPSLDPRYRGFVGNSLTLAGIAAAVTVAGAVLVGFRARLQRRARARALLVGAGLGYAVPGGVIAVGLLVPFAGLDNAIDGWARHASRRLDRAALHRLDLAAGARLHGALHGGGAQRLRRRARHGQPADRRGGAHPRPQPAGGARRRCTCRS